jgi:hypothetical protein
VTHECSTGCGREARDAFVCWQCGRRLREALESLLDGPHPVWPDEVLPGLLVNLDETLAQQTALERSSTATPDPEPYDRHAVAGASRRPIPLDLRASDASTHLRGILVGWVRVLLEETTGGLTTGHTASRAGLTGTPEGDGTPADTPSALVAFLRDRVDVLRNHEAGSEAVGEILDAVSRIRRVVDRAEDWWYAGRCRCGDDLYAKLYASVIECDCGASYDVHARRAELLASVEDVLAPATEIARALTTLDTPVSRSSIAGYAHRGRLVEKGRDRRDRPLYRVGDVRALIGERARAS